MQHEQFNLFHLSSHKQCQLELESIEGPLLRNKRISAAI